MLRVINVRPADPDHPAFVVNTCEHTGIARYKLIEVSF
jgi:hypothetical protein